MTERTNEEILTGGNMNAVVRTGDAVRRPAGPWTETIHRLLRHVRSQGIDWVPEPRGIDGQGREILSFLPGVVPTYPMPVWVWSEAMLIDAAQRLRRWHDATADFPDDSTVWQLPAHGPAEVICHNDFAPYNFVCADGKLVGVIDFDTASPGSRIWDVSYLAYTLCPLAAPSNLDGRFVGDPFSIAAQDQRLNLLLTAYGAAFSARATFETVIDRLEDLATFSERRAIDRCQPEFVQHAILYRNDAVDVRRRLSWRFRSGLNRRVAS